MNGTDLATLTGHTGTVVSCAFSPDGACLVSGSADETLKLWDAATMVLIATHRGHTGAVYGCAFSRDGTRVLAGYVEGTVVWDVETTAALCEFRGIGDVTAVAWDQCGERLVVGSLSGIIYLLQLENVD